MDKDTRERFKALLLDQPFWNDLRDRRAFLRDLFAGHRIMDELEVNGRPATVASELLDLCGSFDGYLVGGLPPCCALLREIQHQGKSGDAVEATAAPLEQVLCHRFSRPQRLRWFGAPYPGLHYFDREDALIFFGREAETQELIDALCVAQRRAFVIVVGASGSGKSSLVRAGLWAQLAQGQCQEIPNSASWLITAMTPSDGNDDPLRSLVQSVALASHDPQRRDLVWFRPGDEYRKLQGAPETFLALVDRLLERRPGAKWLLILDQMEELFSDTFRKTRETFFDLLLDATQPKRSNPDDSESPVEPSRFCVIATLRADFYDRAVVYPALRHVLREGQVPIGRPTRWALERMVTGPIEDLDLMQHDVDGRERKLELAVDSGLPPRIAAEAADQPGGLALMAFALRDLYDSAVGCSHPSLSLEAYLDPAFGGLSGAIARRADEVLAELGTDGRDALPRVFSFLIHVRQQDDGAVLATRRRERLATWDRDEGAQHLIDKLTEARLLVRHGSEGQPATVEVAHEALLREWPTLRDWIASEREAFRHRDRVIVEAHEWAIEGRQLTRLWPRDYINKIRAKLGPALLTKLELDLDVYSFLASEGDWLVAELCCHTTDHVRRGEILERLSEIGDPRAGVGHVNGLPDILWRAIPGGEVATEASIQFEVAPFFMGAYPVTNAQFAAFVQATDGYSNQAWWSNREQPPLDETWLNGAANHPAVNVSWFDATAYCLWLTARLGFEVRLPDEWEWLWAAQSARDEAPDICGPEWADGRLKASEASIGRTTAVGMYPDVASAQGVYDLASNVWEWCRNGHQDAQAWNTGAEWRVVRGGSWYFLQDLAAAPSRLAFGPDVRYLNLGFRLACDSPIRSDR